MAILLVMLQHFTMLAPGQHPLVDVWMTLAHFGFAGLDLFFALSGFLITKVLLELQPTRANAFAFYARRGLRTLPLYFLTLIVVLHLLPWLLPERLSSSFWVNEPRSPLWYWTLTSNIGNAVEGDFAHRWLGVAWSLAVEEQFYLVWPILIFLTRREHLRALCIGLAITALAVRFTMQALRFSDEAIYVLTPCRMDVLALGALVAIATRETSREKVLRSFRWPASIAGLLVLALSVRAYLSRPEERHRESFFLEDFWMQGVGYSGLAILAAGAVALGQGLPRGGWLERILTSAFLLHMGRLSYALYLFHMGAVIFTFSFVTKVLLPGDLSLAADGGLTPLGQAALYALAFGLSYGAAELSWRFFEAPILRLKDRFPYARQSGQDC